MKLLPHICFKIKIKTKCLSRISRTIRIDRVQHERKTIYIIYNLSEQAGVINFVKMYMHHIIILHYKPPLQEPNLSIYIYKYYTLNASRDLVIGRYLVSGIHRGGSAFTIIWVCIRSPCINSIKRTYIIINDGAAARDTTMLKRNIIRIYTYVGTF